ncbi:hypothetical protein Z968_11125 [Clostridium novyi A str. 4552]|uniref:DUF86 domain-containing protein n=1 Tax=Clostridium novyi A str. 4552 TaxID=1444289 RepID=A0A0A0I1W3_CLONO|nr:hypothetical protein [Clostridium novyi]KGM94747.1 hypothetical protein Z968_11125 [Clostridium novyi A str. 4552]
MVKLNNRKLKVILENTEQVINDLEFDLDQYEQLEGRKKEMCSRAIRNDIADIFKNLEDYLALVLKKIGVCVSDRSFRECINLALEKKLLHEGFGKYIVDKIKIRNFFSHRYNYPKTEELIKLYKGHEEVFKFHIDFMKELSNEISRKEDIDIF